MEAGRLPRRTLPKIFLKTLLIKKHRSHICDVCPIKFSSTASSLPHYVHKAVMLSLQPAWGRRTQTDKQHKDETCALSKLFFVFFGFTRKKTSMVKTNWLFWQMYIWLIATPLLECSALPPSWAFLRHHPGQSPTQWMRQSMSTVAVMWAVNSSL